MPAVTFKNGVVPFVRVALLLSLSISAQSGNLSSSNKIKAHVFIASNRKPTCSNVLIEPTFSYATQKTTELLYVTNEGATYGLRLLMSKIPPNIFEYKIKYGTVKVF